MENASYCFPKHAFCCLTDNRYVFLDLRNNEYLCLGRTHTDIMKRLLNRYLSVADVSSDLQPLNAACLDEKVVVRSLLEKGLLTESKADDKLAPPAVIEAPSASLMDEIDNTQSSIRPTHLWNFIIAAIMASNHLRWKSIEHTVRAVEARNSGGRSQYAAVDPAVITSLCQTFRLLRAYYPRPYLCLFDSLALLHFLARYDVFPQWVYGVRLEPFAAHCWVQAGPLVINDIMDNVRSYTPIMSV